MYRKRVKDDIAGVNRRLKLTISRTIFKMKERKFETLFSVLIFFQLTDIFVVKIYFELILIQI